MTSSLLERLRAAVGDDHVLVEEDLTRSYATDWTGRWSGRPVAVVRPADTSQVAAVVTACADVAVPLVPQGGNTGLVGAGVPAEGEVVLSLARLDRVLHVDAPGRTLLAQAGVALARAQAAARAAGLDVGIDFAARDSATLGGIAATNAGGERVMRHGTTRAQVLGLEAVLADGSVVRRLSGLPKDNSGYDLTQLLVGSEGTLGVITAVLLRLAPATSRRTTALLALPGLDRAAEALADLRAGLTGLDAAEFFLRDGLALVLDRSHTADPFERSWAAYLLVDVAEADPEDVAPVLAAVLDRIGGDAVLAQTPTDRRRLWELREGHTEAVNAAGVPVKLDVAVPVAALAGFVEGLPQLVAAVAPSARVVVFGHLAEGNVHLNLLDAVAADADGAVTDAVLRRVAELGGSISAEHGIGRSKRRWLPLTRGPADLAAMRAVKAALDPAGILSPGRVLP